MGQIIEIDRAQIIYNLNKRKKRKKEKEEKFFQDQSFGIHLVSDMKKEERKRRRKKKKKEEEEEVLVSNHVS